MLLKGELGGLALKSWKLHCLSWKNHGIVFLNFCGNPVKCAFGKLSYFTFQRVNNKGADQTAWRHRLLCSFVVCIQLHVYHDDAHRTCGFIFQNRSDMFNR